MKIRVISEFCDKFHTSIHYKVGTVLDFGTERANDIISRKLGVAVEETEQSAEPEPKVEVPEEKVEEHAVGSEVEEPVAEPAAEEVAAEAEAEQPENNPAEEAAVTEEPEPAETEEPEKPRRGRKPAVKEEV